MLSCCYRIPSGIQAIFVYLLSASCAFAEPGKIHSSYNSIDDSISILINKSQEVLQKNEDKAFVLGQKAIDLAKRKKDDSHLAEAELNMAKLIKGVSLQKKAIPHYENAIKAYSRISALKKIPYVKGLLGRTHYALGNYTGAMREYMEALTMYEELDLEDENLGWLLRYIGSVFNQEQDYNKAMEYYIKALDVFKKVDDKDGMASVYNTIGNVYLGLNKFNSALKMYLKGLDLCRETKHNYRAAIINDNIGGIFRTKGNYVKAVEYYTAAYEYLIDSTKNVLDYSFIAQNRINLGDLYLEKKEYNTALNYYTVAERMANRSEKKRLMRLKLIYKGKYQVYELLKNHESALYNYKLFRDLEDSLEGRSVVNLINKLESDYYAQKDLRKIDKLNAEKDVLAIEREREKENTRRAWNWIILLILVVIAVIGFSVVILNQKRKIEVANANLVGKNIEVVKSEQKIRELATAHSIAKGMEPEEMLRFDDKYSGSALLMDQKEELLNRITRLMEEDKIFKEKDLTVVVVAKRLNTNKTYISQVINEQLNMNFSSYVNEYRVKEARQILTEKESRHLKIEAIAGQAGFNSVSAFNNAYKKFTGITPSFYLKSILSRENS